ncbi:MAG TPA: hypothetical protein VGF61_03100 [Candidatus Acidoferrum sp.]|jgi:hypothetical protein
MRRLVLSFLFLSLALSASTNAQSIPPVKTKTLADTDIVLPQPGGTQILVLVLGFSHKSGENCAAWGKRLSADFHSDTRVTYYQLPVLQGAPSFVRPMILRGMRKDMPAEQQAHFVPILDHEDEWKKLANFSGPDDCYILLTDPRGHVVWQTHGPVTDASYEALKSALSKALASLSAG